MSRKNASGPNSSSADVKAKTRSSAWRPQSVGMESSVALELAAPSPMAAMSQATFSAARTARMGLIQLRMSWYVMYFQLPGLPERTLHRVIPRLWRDWSPPGADVADDVAITLAALPTAAHRAAAIGYYRALVRPGSIGAPYAEFGRYLQELPCAPILYLHGTDDGAMQVGYTEQLLHALPAGSAVQTIDGAGHFLQIDRPNEVAVAILDYVEN